MPCKECERPDVDYGQKLCFDCQEHLPDLYKDALKEIFDLREGIDKALAVDYDSDSELEIIDILKATMKNAGSEWK